MEFKDLSVDQLEAYAEQAVWEVVKFVQQHYGVSESPQVANVYEVGDSAGGTGRDF